MSFFGLWKWPKIRQLSHSSQATSSFQLLLLPCRRCRFSREEEAAAAAAASAPCHFCPDGDNFEPLLWPYFKANQAHLSNVARCWPKQDWLKIWAQNSKKNIVREITVVCLDCKKKNHVYSTDGMLGEQGNKMLHCSDKIVTVTKLVSFVVGLSQIHVVSPPSS